MRGCFSETFHSQINRNIFSKYLLRHGLTYLPEEVVAVGKLKLKGTVAVRLVARSVNGIVRENEEPKIYKFLVNSLEIIKIMVWKLSRSWFGNYQDHGLVAIIEIMVWKLTSGLWMGNYEDHELETNYKIMFWKLSLRFWFENYHQDHGLETIIKIMVWKLTSRLSSRKLVLETIIKIIFWKLFWTL